ncbi:metal-dependent transcriptional regulator [Lignipirellula cremea]|uniref:Transcriptional regulator MntR n=1 Tax=Lignipirellula cremea TaxID=2528010 RepID=A0A518E0A5_9BACT|nr:metal-dependent transcriptional regulator [Lignipirellula cremea]QDU97491.1 Iron-dependent repressor IdeR [Lignipirellula cremea]
MASLTVENYIKTIYQICIDQNDTPAGTGKIADILGVSPGTVTSMLKGLSESGMVTYTPYTGVILTESGRSLALRVLRRHRLIELFLTRTLALSWDEVHAEAENMEHSVSDFLIDRIDAYLGYPENDPHGDPIPRADGTVPLSNGESLADLKINDHFYLLRVLDQSQSFLRFLSEAGLELNSQGRVVSNSPEGGVISIEVDGRPTTLSHEAAKKLFVAMTESP